MMITTLMSRIALGVLLAASSVSAAPPTMDQLPPGSWMSVNRMGDQIMLANEHAPENAHLTPAQQRQLAQVQQRFLRQETEGFNAQQAMGLKKETLQGTSMEQTAFQFVDSSETFFSEYAQMWRMLGMYIDCDSSDGEQKRQRQRQRELDQQNNQYGQYQQNQYGQYQQQQQQQNENENENENQNGCVRYLVWAAYVDLDHEGNGMGEYALWDRHSNSWDRSACGTTGGNRCVNMDCHLPGTNMALIGFFKEPNYHEWMEQLFKHEGICAWNYWNGCDTYESMQEMREAWPEQCTQVYYNNEVIYYDIAPQPEGRIALGLYSDARCSEDYKGSATVVEVMQAYTGDYDYQNYDAEQEQAAQYGEQQQQYGYQQQQQYGYQQQQAYDNGNGDNMIQEYCANKDNQNDNGHQLNDAYRISRNIKIWNDAFDQWKYCQPCKAYDLGKTTTNQYGNQDELEKEDLENMGAFQCDDDAGYKNVNQCMKFKTKTKMIPASFSEVLKASEQGTLTSFRAGNTVYGQVMGDRNLAAVIGGWLVLLIGAAMLLMSYRGKRDASMASDTKEPFLEPTKDGVLA